MNERVGWPGTPEAIVDHWTWRTLHSAYREKKTVNYLNQILYGNFFWIIGRCDLLLVWFVILLLINKKIFKKAKNLKSAVELFYKPAAPLSEHDGFFVPQTDVNTGAGGTWCHARDRPHSGPGTPFPKPSRNLLVCVWEAQPWPCRWAEEVWNVWSFISALISDKRSEWATEFWGR